MLVRSPAVAGIAGTAGYTIAGSEMANQADQEPCQRFRDGPCSGLLAVTATKWSNLGKV